MEDRAKAYDKGTAYLRAAKRVMAATVRLDEADASAVRKLADRLMVRGLDLISRAVKAGDLGR